MNYESRYELGKKCALYTIIANIILSIFKIFAGIIAYSQAMVADGFHSLSDVLSSILVIIGLKISSKPADDSHPYGHEKVEPIMSKLLATLLFYTALSIGYKGIKALSSGEFNMPGGLALWAAATSILVKEGMYWYTIFVAKKISSPSLMADAWHHRSDAFSSIGTFAGIAGARMGFLFLDSVAAIVVSIFILKIAVDIYIQAINQLIDKSAPPQIVEGIKNTIESVSGVERVDELKTRIHANKIYADIEIAVKPTLTVENSHKIAEEVHQKVEAFDDEIKHCSVHVNPYK